MSAVPPACGLTLRRLAVKINLRTEVRTLEDALAPAQVGCCVAGGAKDGVHALRAFQAHPHSGSRVLVKLDFQNAFNTVRRDWMLRQVEEHCPKLFRMARQAYATESTLVASEALLSSAMGVQQGDPAGPALFCLALKPLTDSLGSTVAVSYLDDIVLAGEVPDVLEDVRQVIDFGRLSGLQLNTDKCEIFHVSGSP